MSDKETTGSVTQGRDAGAEDVWLHTQRQMSDEELMDRVTKNEDGAIDRIKATWGPRLRDAFFVGQKHLDNDTAEECCSRTLTKVWHGRRNYESGKSFAAWIMTIAGRVWYDCVFRGDKFNRIGDGRKMFSVPLGPEDELDLFHISNSLTTTFFQNKLPLPGDSSVEVITRGSKWRILCNEKFYTVVRTTTLDIYRSSDTTRLITNNSPGSDDQWFPGDDRHRIPESVGQAELSAISQFRWSDYAKEVSCILSGTTFPPSVRRAVERLIKPEKALPPGDLEHMSRLISGLLRYNEYHVENDPKEVHREEILAYCVRDVLHIPIPTAAELSANAATKITWASHWSPLSARPPGNFTRWVTGFKQKLKAEYFSDCLKAMRRNWSSWTCGGPFPDSLLPILRKTNPHSDDEQICLDRAIVYLVHTDNLAEHKLAFALVSLMGNTPCEAQTSQLWEPDWPTPSDVEKWNRNALESIINNAIGT